MKMDSILLYPVQNHATTIQGREHSQQHRSLLFPNHTFFLPLPYNHLYFFMPHMKLSSFINPCIHQWILCVITLLRVQSLFSLVYVNSLRNQMRICFLMSLSSFKLDAPKLNYPSSQIIFNNILGNNYIRVLSNFVAIEELETRQCYPEKLILSYQIPVRH